MNIHAIRVSSTEVNAILAQAKPVTPAGRASEDACAAYRRVRPAIEIAMPILAFLYPPGAAALATVKVILDKACEEKK